MSQNIIDKIINHLVAEHILRKYLESSLIDSNIATRENKGTSYGIYLLKKYINKIKKNEFYILKFDIKKYFYNIDHGILKDLLSNRFDDKDILNLLFNIIDSTDSDYINETIRRLNSKDIPFIEKGKSLPIGNMTSQILAIYYLNELDHYIKEKLHIKYYIRYMDDGIILHNDKEYLKYVLKEIRRIVKKYKLELNEDKTRIFPSKQGITFIGYRFILNKNNKLILKISNDTKKRFKKKIKLINKGIINKDKGRHIIASYKGYLKYGNTNSLLRLGNIKEDINIGKESRIDDYL